MFQQIIGLAGIGLVAGLATLSSSSTTEAPATEGAYTIDAVHSSALFSAVHLGMSRFYGRFNEMGGELSFDPKDPTKSTIKVEIAAASVDSNDTKRDQHLAGPDFFSAKEFETISFESKSVAVKRKATDEDALQLEVTGMLDMLGKKREVTAVVDLVGSGPGMRGGELIGFHTVFEINRSEWGMDYMNGPLSDEVEIILSLEAKR